MFSNSQIPELNKLVAETNNKLKHLDKNICCKLDNLPGGSGGDVETYTPVYTYAKIAEPNLVFDSVNNANTVSDFDVKMFFGPTSLTIIPPTDLDTFCDIDIISSPEIDLEYQTVSYEDDKGRRYTNTYEGNVYDTQEIFFLGGIYKDSITRFTLKLSRYSGFTIVYEGLYITGPDGSILDDTNPSDPFLGAFVVTNVTSNTNSTKLVGYEINPFNDKKSYLYPIDEFREYRLNGTFQNYQDKFETPVPYTSSCYSYAPIPPFMPLNMRAIEYDFTTSDENTSQAISTGGVSQDLYLLDRKRKYIYIQNTSAANLRIGLGTNPTATTGILLTPGASFIQQFPHVFTGVLKIFGAVTGQTFEALIYPTS